MREVAIIAKTYQTTFFSVLQWNSWSIMYDGHVINMWLLVTPLSSEILWNWQTFRVSFADRIKNAVEEIWIWYNFTDSCQNILLNSAVPRHWIEAYLALTWTLYLVIWQKCTYSPPPTPMPWSTLRNTSSFPGCVRCHAHMQISLTWRHQTSQSITIFHRKFAWNLSVHGSFLMNFTLYPWRHMRTYTFTTESIWSIPSLTPHLGVICINC